MIILDTKLKQLEQEGRPIRVGLVGAGYAGRGFALQLLTVPEGMKLVAIANRTPSYAYQAYEQAGVTNVEEITTAQQLATAIKDKKPCITQDPLLLCASPDIDCIVEATGEIEFGAQVAMAALQHKKHLIAINAELDGTIGPILNVYAKKQGVVYTQGDGDQPAKLMNLSREIASMGFRPVLAGNIKSLLDFYRTPETQKGFAAMTLQRTKHVTSFADGTKISYEMATTANAMGFRVGKRGMYGPACTHVDEAATKFSQEELLRCGLVDYILGAQPSFGIFVLGYSNQPVRAQYMKNYKMGDGPLYTFYVPYHLSPLESPNSVARAVLFQDATLAPIAGPYCDVLSIAKKDLQAGDVLDGVGGFTCYGTIDNTDVCRRENLLPMGLTPGCVVKHAIPKDQPLTFADVTFPEHRLCDKLWKEQEEFFSKK